MKVLITGFEPFGKEMINPSYEAVKLLPDKLGNCDIIKKELPVTFGSSLEVLEKHINEYNPDIIICVGQAGGRSGISIERVAINIDDARIPDNNGKQPVDKKIYPQGPDAYFATIPIKAIVYEIRGKGIPASVSNSAGTFACNHVMYGLLYILNTKYKNKKGGFIHVPYLPQQVVNKNHPSMSLNNIVIGLEAAISASLKYKKDMKFSEGKEY